MNIADVRINTMDVRKHLGEFLNRVLLKNEEFTILRSGKPVARLVPIKKQVKYDAKLSDAAGLGEEVWERHETGEYLDHLRESWKNS